jgi:hypothetical protein
MQNTIKILGIIAIVAVIGITMAACSGGGGGGKLSGTYSSDDGSITFTFSGKKLTAEAFGQKGEGTYEIKDGKLITTSSDGKTATYNNFKIEGNKLSYELWEGNDLVLTKK